MKIKMQQNEENTRDRKLFLSLLVLSVMILGIIVSGIWYLNLTNFNHISRIILLVVGIIITLFSLIVVLGIVGILIILRKNEPVSFFYGPIRIVISYLFPLVIYLGKILGFDRLEIKNSFIRVNNQLVKPNRLEVAPENILMLLPHCIQQVDCEYRITNDLDNCRRCGRCPVDDILQLRDKYGIKVAVATGGTLARRIIKEVQPRAIIAVACERDLTSGIQDTYPLPVIGVVNIRPEGPCINTLVEIEKLEKAINKLL
ncbi:DUF116 domain-containing protein [Acetohalobium arabaticum]|uniref:DUF116 domain-containing protein n=1 Tax=Acetohalobium arabaticum (strain ATCC 49924 / DSM 5501 / Z-7288) TaxID=574087 RepID=D9QR09_ACEAZ|nr:DUF116 domain-containing protein [Acetohalobium arabaticum]ADL12950.1 protein of unknown function DUF116 [Acetohalobium arabaticum DSM 5501]